MTGTIVNFLAIIAGSLIGLCLKKGLPNKLQDAAMTYIGLGIFVVAINGILGSMLIVNVTTGRVSDNGGMVLIISLVVGGIIGEMADIDGALNRFGMAIERKLGKEGFAKGFITASLLFCIGAMAIIGAIADGVNGDSKILFTKSTLDFITSILLSASLGFGVMFAAIPVLLYQGAIAIGSEMLSGVLVGALLDQICMVGYAIVLVLATNMMGITKYKTANMLPCILVPVAYSFIVFTKSLLL